MYFVTLMSNIAQFSLHAHTLRVETGCWQIHNRHCDKCGLDDVQEGKHVLYSCPSREHVLFERKSAEKFCHG